MKKNRGIKVTKKNKVDMIMSYESGELSQVQIIQLFSYLIKTDLAWKLQGSIYGRPANRLIEMGIISPKTGKINWKEYDNFTNII